jgi:CDGSH-type Zn-finger protein/truncated hemoglobin YjbI
MREISRTLAVHLPAGHSHSLLATPPERLAAGDLDALLGRASDLAAAVAGRGGDDETGSELAGLFQAAHSIVTESAAGRGCDGEERAVIMPRLVNGVLRPLADLLGRATASQQAVRAPAGPAGTQADRLWDLTKTATALRVRLGRTGTCPPELAEATAALQDAARLLVPPAEAAARVDELWQLESGLPATVQTARNGPYLVTNVPRLVDYLGGQQRPVPQLALCRCGQSSTKPRCDGSHASGFNDAKDPSRVADRRDTYPGQQVEIMDNRGICQHSGLCTDRLATVFRTNAEPFVAPSGGRMDEIIRAVRDCPSGALSYAIDGVEAREQVDRAGTRPPSIEITKDGPYRVTGQMALSDADGSPVARSQGASLEHYALCRCGQSQNKPFCSGMHWHVGFTDPAVPPGHEPTLFEWAGGLPALIRMTRRLYEHHVPDDPRLAAAFGGMPADQPQRLAGWLAAALGAANNDGPARDASAGNGGTGAELRSAIGLPGWPDGDEQRTRWLSLAGRAADEAGLPGDPGFRSALSSCLEWASRALGQPDADQPSCPRWHGGPGGPPAPAAPEGATADAPLPEPGQPVGFAAHIKPLFREKDRQSMSFAFDLWSYDDVRGRAAEILARLQDGTMPCDGTWPAEKTEVFRRWIDAGTQP